MMSLFLVQVLLVFVGISGSTSMNHVFVQTGEDLILDLTEAKIPTSYSYCFWQFQGLTLIMLLTGSSPRVHQSYNNRFEILEKKCCVKLKNAHKSDSGIYTAKLAKPDEQILTEYNVKVQDPVSQPHLYIEPVSSNSSSCNFTAMCTTEDSTIRSSIRCDNKICHQDEGKRSVVTQSGASLDMYLSHSSISCNHSNQVSWSEKTVEILQLCRHCADLSVVYLVKKVLLPVGLIIMVSAVVGVHVLEKVKKRK